MCDEFNFGRVSVLVKTVKGYERVAAQIIRETFPEVTVLPEPLGFSGLVLVMGDESSEQLAEKIKARVPEVEKVFPIAAYAPADLEALCEVSIRLAELLRNAKNFAVQTVRRGSHSFRSLDVNYRLGAILKEATGLPVNLDFPDKVFFVEIIGPHAYLGVVDGAEFPKKMAQGKVKIRPYFKRVSLVQMPYLGSLDASREMGARVGREAQTFEVGELVIAPIGAVNAEELNAFLKGVFEGIESRFTVQAKTYAEKPHRTRVYVQNLYELVRERASEPIIVFEPEGEPIDKMGEKLAELILKNKRVNFLIGSREGIPHGIFRFASFVIDLCPSVTLSTDLAAASALTALAFTLHQKLSCSKP
ncbi:SPOUT family RNA methylase [Candidatus Bathyarchaeota archaeon]|nr:SPOUT family RNA methylase [Candidatus Bathyarchaeota archaeon]